MCVFIRKCTFLYRFKKKKIVKTIKICYIINIKTFGVKFSAKDGGSLNDQDRENIGDEP